MARVFVSQIVDPLPEGVEATQDTLYPDGAHLKDLKEVRDLIYYMQRPGIAPEVSRFISRKREQCMLIGLLASAPARLRRRLEA
jgi:hypothetical protein